MIPIYIANILLFSLTLLQNTLHEGVQEKLLHMEMRKILKNKKSIAMELRNISHLLLEESHQHIYRWVGSQSWVQMGQNGLVTLQTYRQCDQGIGLACLTAPVSQWQPLHEQMPYLIYLHGVRY